MRFVLSEITVAGNLIDTRADLEDLVMLTAHGKVVLRSTRYWLEAANDAIGGHRRGRIRGRAILGPG
jgi:D-arabinose 1-dehydrogenase-like Zn-dependent alcohol dehydrogenase